MHVYTYLCRYMNGSTFVWSTVSLAYSMHYFHAGETYPIKTVC